MRQFSDTVRTTKPGGSSSARGCTSRLELDRQQVVAHYDARAGREAALESDKRGLGLAVLRKRKLAAQKLVVLLVGLAHNVPIGARRLASLGIGRLVQEGWAIPGRVKLPPEGPRRIRLRRAHSRAREVGRPRRPFLGPSEREPLALWD